MKSLQVLTLWLAAIAWAWISPNAPHEYLRFYLHVFVWPGFFISSGYLWVVSEEVPWMQIMPPALLSVVLTLTMHGAKAAATHLVPFAGIVVFGYLSRFVKPLVIKFANSKAAVFFATGKASIPLMAAPCALIFFFSPGWGGFPEQISPLTFIFFFYFLFGNAVGYRPELEDNMTFRWQPRLAVTMLMTLLLLRAHVRLSNNGGPNWRRGLFSFGSSFLSWPWSYALVGVFKEKLSIPQRLTDSAMWVYAVAPPVALGLAMYFNFHSVPATVIGLAAGFAMGEAVRFGFADGTRGTVVRVKIKVANNR